MFAAAVAAWWPLGGWWQSDDFIALHWSNDFSRALGDFAGNQYGLTGMVWFYRPLITLSFWLDQQIGGTDPFVSHLSNALAHGASAVLLALLACRFVSAGAAVGAALVWALHPAHAGSLLWAVGRVDSHTMVWILLGLWSTARAVEGRRGARWLALLAMLLALGSKELAVVVPPLAAVVAFGVAPPGRRMAAALRASWPLFVLLLPYFALRWMLFDRLVGGYEGSALQPVAAARGLGEFTLTLLNPLHGTLHDGARLLAGHGIPQEVAWAGFLPALLGAAVLCARRRFGLLAGITVCYLIAAAPTVQFWAASDYALNLRYFYLPTACLAVLIAGAGWPNALLALAVAALPLLDTRQRWRAFGEQLAAMHGTLLREARELPAGPMFVAGLPRTAADGVLGFYLGVDRLLAPPFSDAGQRLYALRPIEARGDAHALPYGDEVGLPCGRTFAFDGATVWHEAPPARVAPLAATIEGPRALTRDVLWQLYRDPRVSRFVMREAAPMYRITAFTAAGYLCAILPNEAGSGSDASGGVVSVGAWLQARYAVGGAHTYVLAALSTPSVLDLSTEFPVLIEAGEMKAVAAGLPEVFAVRAATRELLSLTLDRGYAEFLAGR